MATVIRTEEFLERGKTLPIIDVRSPGEYEHAHIPGALNLPLFSDEERAETGTIYKKKGQIPAIQRGLELAGPKLADFTRFALSLKSREILIHCWRGGMRSSSMAWLLERVGLECYLLEGGYKAYRNFVLTSFETPFRGVLLGGYTGSGKSEVLQKLSGAGEQVIDLEQLANHKGSAFGSLGQPPQPSKEQFENELCNILLSLDMQRIVWIEDESRNIGKITLPEGLWKRMRYFPLIKLDTDREIRLQRLIRDYTCFSRVELSASISKIEKRLGYDRCRMTLKAVSEGNTPEAVRICLDYYDSAYSDQLTARYGKDLTGIRSIKSESLDPSTVIEELIKAGAELAEHEDSKVLYKWN
ncbi:MAG: tRNA 2-selenouridine(34) synthase MnmH [Bacteroidales bacterium]|nr:tRNA 2-selenouridine(34) synthase MnmH [Bacteroidales bacterium]MDD3990161.1 tRNA 2-selenouridine(34) synthase MnmH [Bacteroidales bacterium]MDD4639622.1 tRNA 2-selenouridine(34) synthase MnmH [Bacteroidales bacterium]